MGTTKASDPEGAVGVHGLILHIRATVQRRKTHLVRTTSGRLMARMAAGVDPRLKVSSEVALISLS